MSYSIPSFCKGSIRGDGADRGGSGQEDIVCWENSRLNGALMGSSPAWAPAHRANPDGSPVFRT